MRQIGKLPQEQDAQRLAAYLVTLGIDAHAEQDTYDWTIWVRDENRLDEARHTLEKFRQDPTNARYLGAEREADSIRRDAVQKRLDAQRNVIGMRDRWKSARGAPMPPAPLTNTMILLSIIVSLVGGFGKAEKGLPRTINDELYFVSPVDYDASIPAAGAQGNPLASVAKGELWRAITPIFIHLDFPHLVFNMIMFFQLGRLLEALLGTSRLAILILVVAVLANVAQAIAPSNVAAIPSALWGSPLFGGMSGVVYGLFGYAWMRSIFRPNPGYQLHPIFVVVMIGWLFLCMTPLLGNVANVAHIVGLISGCTFEVIPAMLRR